MKFWTIGKRITFGFATILVLVAALAVIAFFLLQRITVAANNLATQSLPAANCISAINDGVSNAHLSLVNALNAKSVPDRKAFEKEIVDAKAAITKSMDDYEKLIKTSEDRDNFNQLKNTRLAYLATRDKALKLLDDDQQDDAQNYADINVRPAYEKYGKIIDKVLSWNLDAANRVSAETKQTSTAAQLTVGIISIAVIFLGIVFASIIVVGLTKALTKLAGELNEGANQVSSAASQVSAGSQSLAEGASEQAASIEETSASLTEISSTTEHNTQTAQATKEFAIQTLQAAEQGAESTERMHKSIDGIKDASDKMGVAMDSIKTASKDIANIIKTIDEIAFQTNLLALNAAVEAARAGEAGAGFAVVADEVRNLAQRSAKAAKETATMIEAAISRSEAGVMANQEVKQAVSIVVAEAQEVGNKLKEIVTKVHQVDEQVLQVATASREQSQGISQISTAVSEMERVTQSNASSAEESASAAEELNAQAETLKGSVRELQALVGGVQANTPILSNGGGTPKSGSEMHESSVSTKAFRRRSIGKVAN